MNKNKQSIFRPELFVATSTFFEITGEDITIMLGYVKGLLLDLTPLLLPIIAIGLGILIFWAIVSSFR